MPLNARRIWPALALTVVLVAASLLAGRVETLIHYETSVGHD